MIRKYGNFLNEEVGLRNISKLAKLHKTAEIYFHKDLDGVTSALAMKEFLKNYYQIETVDCHIIQYGGLEYAIKHHQPGNLAVLVDFAHGKPMFHIQSDHHDKQVGAGDTDSTYFKHTRSNVEIISGEISYSDIFTSSDLELIKTVDSANFLKFGITPDDVQNSIFKYQKSESGEKSRFMMGFVVNRLLLAYKNKRISVKSLDGKRNHINKNILECLVLDSTASLYSLFNNIRNYINNAKTSDKSGRLATPEEIKVNLEEYVGKMKNYKFIEDPETGQVSEFDPTSKKHQYLSTSGAKIGKGVHFDEEFNIITQYGGGTMFKPGSYDRYTPFKNFPEAEFLCIVWPMGLIQVSCNPFREKRLKDINLGEVAKEVLATYEPTLNKFFVSLESIKREFETSQDWKQMKKAIGEDYEGVGFKFSDLEAFYIDCIFSKVDNKVKNVLNKIVEIDFIAVDDNYENIKVLVSHQGKTYIFGIKENQSLKDFISKAATSDVEMYSDKIGTLEGINSEISQKQIEGAKNNISNFLKSSEFVVTKKEKLYVYSSLIDDSLKEAMNQNYDNLSQEQKDYLSKFKIPVWELIIRNSGGHPSITNISGLNFLAYNKEVLKLAYGTDRYVEVLKQMARDLVNNLKQKIELVKKGQSVQYDTKGVQLLGQDTNESYEYHVVNKSTGKTSQVTRDEFLKAGVSKGMKTDRKSLMTIDTQNKRVIAKFESFKKHL